MRTKKSMGRQVDDIVKFVSYKNQKQEGRG
jgi:hypothetical protein